MKGTLRKSMTWLHTWSSITAGWLLFAIFLTGTLSFFRSEITHWMKPELHQSVPSANSVQIAWDHLVSHAPDAERWNISLPDSRRRTIDLAWRTPGEQGFFRGPRAQLDPTTGATLDARDTAGGFFLYRFHFELWGMDRATGRLIVMIVSMMMFIGIISGIIMHRKIFTDFFMFRPKKKLLSWIDGHAISAVLALPFHIMITFSGLLLLAGAMIPWNDGGFHRHGPPQSGELQAPPRIEKHFEGMPPFNTMMDYAQQQWRKTVTSIAVDKPGTADATYTLSANNRTEISAGRGGNTSLTFNQQGEPIKVNPATTAPNISQAVYNYFDMLHQARFADTMTRWVLFIAGVLGTIMVGTGSILWAVKRGKQQAGRFGFELIRGLNIGSIAGLLTACSAYFWANRLAPIGLSDRSLWEIGTFFTVWALGLVAGLIWRDRKGWLAQLTFGAVLFTLLPVLDSVTSSATLIFAVANGDWMRLSFDAMALITAACMWSGVYYLAVLKSAKQARRASVRQAESTRSKTA